MADEQTQDQQTQDTQPAINPDAIKAMVEGAVKTSLEGVLAKARQEQEEAAALKAQQTQVETTTGKDIIGDIVKPHLEVTLKAAKDAETRAMLAADAATFYTDPGNMDAVEYRGKIEEVMTAQLKRGNVISRSDAWRWLRGGELYDEINKKRDASRAKKEEEAKYAMTAGSSVQRPAPNQKPADQMSTQELTDTLRGISF